MKDSDRRSILRHLTNEQYDDILRVSSSYPLIDMDCKVKGYKSRMNKINKKFYFNLNFKQLYSFSMIK